MGINKTYAVLGLGRYGTAVARELAADGADIIAVDINEEIVNELATEMPLCKCADITDPEAMRQLGIANIDIAVIAMASNLEASVMAVMLCKEAGVKTVVAKCASEMHRKILSKVGADKVVLPENESGIRLAKNFLSSGFMDIIELSKNVAMVEIDVRPEWIGKTLIELKLRQKYSINVVAVCEDSNVSTTIDPEMLLKDGMKLIVIANKLKLNKLK
jgi:trk system potassium uptake protein TrkA